MIKASGETRLHLPQKSSDSQPGGAEAFCFTATTTGTHFVRVQHFVSTGTGTYDIMIANCASTFAPDVTISKSGPTSATCGDTITYTLTASNVGTSNAMSVMVTDDLPDCLSNVMCSVSPMGSGTCSVGGGNVVTADLGTLTDGESVTITITATVNPSCAPSFNNQAMISTTSTESDDTNNTSGTVTTTVTDTTPPSITCPANITVGTNVGCTYLGSIGSATATDNCDPSVTITSNAPAAFPLGMTTVTWTATDDAGNTSTCTQTVTVVDDDPPPITCPSNITVGTNVGCTYVGSIGTATATDNCDASVTITNNAPAAFPLGSTTVTWKATDDAGNMSTCTQTVTVIDDDPPPITCPANITVGTNSGCTYVGSIGTATATDNCDASVTITNDAPAAFPLGMTIVIWTATDDAGNMSTCTQTVAVVDDDAPPITCPANITVGTNVGCTYVGSIGSATATDNCDPSVTITNNAPAAFPLGSTTVTWTATDDAGNTSTCTQTVMVVDDDPPQITCPADVIGPTNQPDGRVVEFDVTATDNCDPNPVILCRVGDQVITSPHLFPLGTTTVTCTTTDASGNQSQCPFTVMVTAPIASPAVASASFPLAGKAGAQPSTVAGLLVAEFDQDQVAVLMSQGDGRFTRRATVAVGVGPSALALGDLNQDGQTDAVVANLLSNDLSVLIGSGDGRFDRQRSLPVGDQPTAVAIGDFDGDSVPDLAVTSFGDHTVMILHGQGEGTFRAVNRIQVGLNPTGLVVGDFDGDGRLDLATSNFGSDDVTIMQNQGGNRFRAMATVAVGQGPMDLIAGDFDGDGRWDLVTANFLSNDVSLLTDRGLEKASGGAGPPSRFRVTRTLSAGEGPVALAAGPFLTGRLGLAVANRRSGEITLWTGMENGLSDQRQRFAVTAAPVTVTPGDFNGDGRLDLVVLDADGVTRRVLLDDGQGRFRLAP